MFRYRALNLCDEVLSVFLTPYILYHALPQSSGKDITRRINVCEALLAELIVQFLQNYTKRIEGIGDICSLATFDFERHGNKNYGSFYGTEKADRSKQGKMEKSFLSFVACYPSWRPHPCGQLFLDNLKPYLTVASDSDLHSSPDQAQTSNHQEQNFSQSWRERQQHMSIEMSVRASSSSRRPLPQEFREMETSDAVEHEEGVLDVHRSHQALQSLYLARNGMDLPVVARSAR